MALPFIIRRNYKKKGRVEEEEGEGENERD